VKNDLGRKWHSASIFERGAHKYEAGELTTTHITGPSSLSLSLTRVRLTERIYSSTKVYPKVSGLSR